MSVLVTVGTTCFDKLVKVTCQPEFHAELWHLGYRHLTVQYGLGCTVPMVPPQCSVSDAYRIHHRSLDEVHPLSLISFKFKEDISNDILAADLVISHGGSGTCLQALSPPGARRLIVVINDTLSGNHQEELALTLARGKYAVVTKPELLISVLRLGLNESNCSFSGIPYESFPSDVVQFLGPALPPERAGFVGFERCSPRNFVRYLDNYFDRVLI